VFDDARITDPVSLANAQAAREIYVDAMNLNLEIAEPPVAVKIDSGARVMCWLPVATKPYIEEAHRLFIDEPITPIEMSLAPEIRHVPAGAMVQAWLPIEDEDVWQ
jgi:hypothetical protein